MFAYFVKSRMLHIRWYLIDKFHSVVAAERNSRVDDIVLNTVCEQERIDESIKKKMIKSLAYSSKEKTYHQVGACLVDETRKKIVVIDNKVFELIKGTIEPNETSEQAVIREVYEESEIVVDASNIVDSFTIYASPHLLTVFLIIVPNEQFFKKHYALSNEEVQNLKQVDVDALKKGNWSHLWKSLRNQIFNMIQHFH